LQKYGKTIIFTYNTNTNNIDAERQETSQKWTNTFSLVPCLVLNTSSLQTANTQDFSEGTPLGLRVFLAKVASVVWL